MLLSSTEIFLGAQIFLKNVLKNLQISYQNLIISPKFIFISEGIIALSLYQAYLFRLGFHPQSFLNLGKRIQTFESLDCSCSKESISIYKKPNNWNLVKYVLFPYFFCLILNTLIYLFKIKCFFEMCSPFNILDEFILLYQVFLKNFH